MRTWKYDMGAHIYANAYSNFGIHASRPAFAPPVGFPPAWAFNFVGRVVLRVAIVIGVLDPFVIGVLDVARCASRACVFPQGRVDPA